MHPKIQEIIDWFRKINAFPRCSGNEEALAAWLCEWAAGHGFTHRGDDAGNLIIDVPATAGYEAAPIVVFQAHMDMVCEKTPDSNHDFTKDPIVLFEQGDWLTADKTSLGADNGAAIALGIALAIDPAVSRPPLELLFTVDEETGLNGAMKLPADFIRGRILLNVDSEDEGIFTVGCAGGRDALMVREFDLEEVPADHVLFDISAGGMRGGHSGIDIGKHRANANKVLARLLAAARGCGGLRLAALAGGTKHNAIPREASARVAIPAADAEAVEKAVLDLAADIKAEYRKTEPSLAIAVTRQTATGATRALDPADTRTVTACLMALPTGVIETVAGECDQVETSCNLAIVGLKGPQLSILMSQRSAVMSRLAAVSTQIEDVAALAGLEVRTTNQYPAWPVKEDDPLVERCRQVYRKCFDKEPVVEVIHAGLECAVIGSKYPGMEMISFGPTMKNPHSPDEKLNIPSMGKLWDFLLVLLASFRP